MSAEFGQVDSDLASIEQAAARSGGSQLDDIKAELERRRGGAAQTVRYAITRWPSWQAEYRLPATSMEVQQIRKSAEKQAKTDPTFFSRLLLAKCCVGLWYAGEQLFEDDDSPSTWASQGVQRTLGATRATEALTMAYRAGIEDGPGDGEIDQHGLDLIERAGFGDDTQRWVVEQDPTSAG